MDAGAREVVWERQSAKWWWPSLHGIEVGDVAHGNERISVKFWSQALIFGQEMPKMPLRTIWVGGTITMAWVRDTTRRA